MAGALQNRGKEKRMRLASREGSGKSQEEVEIFYYSNFSGKAVEGRGEDCSRERMGSDFQVKCQQFRNSALTISDSVYHRRDNNTEIPMLARCLLISLATQEALPISAS